jgi:hypothetical protein
VPAESARRHPAQAAPRRAYRAEFPARSGLHRPTHSNPAWWAAPVLPAIRLLGAVPSWQAANHPVQNQPDAVLPIVARRAAAHGVARPPEPRPDRAAPAAAVDSKGVPGRFCRWIRKCWECVSNVFSCRLQLIRTDNGIPYFPRVLQMVCTPSHTFPHRERHTMEREALR